MPSLQQTFRAMSPRLNPHTVPIRARLINAVSPLLFAALFVQAFFRQSLAGWSIGIVYILYDTGLLLFTASHIRKATRAPAPPAAGAGPRLGVIVAAHNEAAVIAFTIERLAAQDRAPDLILIADDGSTDATGAVLAERFGVGPTRIGALSPPAAALPSLRWLPMAHGGKSRALNVALEQADTEIVLTVDADTLLEPGAIAAMRDAFAADPALVAATGVLQPICGPSLQGRLFQWFQRYEYVRNFLSRYAWMQLNGLLLISGAFAAFRREAVIAVGGFDPDCLVEDYELIHRLHRFSADEGRGWTIAVVGGAIASTDAPASPIAFLRQRRRWFGGFLQTQHWNRDMVGSAHFGRLGTAMLPVKAMDTFQPIYGLAAFGVLLAFLATGRFVIGGAILLVMLAKIAIDLTFHLWSIGIYKRWTGRSEGLALGPALIAALLEPFSFQLLRHMGALWGWFAFLSGTGGWGRQRRTAIGHGAAV